MWVMKTKETRHILQFHFTTWPDHGTPDPVQLMLFHRQVKDVKTDLNGPPIVHCAAGIGRTGTFIALDTLHDYGDKTGRIDVFEYVMKMRKDRMNMIQTLELQWYPADEMEMNVGSFQIKKVSGPHFDGKMSEISFTVTRQVDEKYVRMLMIRPWPTGRCVPADKKELLKLIEMTLTSQTTSSPVTIVCSDGARGCGLFCTVSNVILNLRLEEEIDIFHTVRQLQIRRPQFISDYDEYKSCYEMVKLYLESSNIYANV
ncbi:hypothetical protein KUTeg_012113 [Tegillarca granosa]|uniref:Uncharacterized protein n=1 Tax=Tegillarca granosa TaxID=220873 RepID=A0ABQ9EYL9_TEGGR|nr:hypothetical protein KUTeg_012113 [Tegillarca granosa]